MREGVLEGGDRERIIGEIERGEVKSSVVFKCFKVCEF